MNCDCKECKDKQKAALETVARIEQKIEEAKKKNLYTMGIPLAKVREIMEGVKRELA